MFGLAVKKALIEIGEAYGLPTKLNLVLANERPIVMSPLFKVPLNLPKYGCATLELMFSTQLFGIRIK